VSFLDEMLNVSDNTLRVEEVFLERDSSFAGKTLAETDIGRKTGLLVVAIRRATGDYHFTPQADAQFQAQDTLIVIGSAAQVQNLRRLNKA
jgi:voltage-gated potassium channel